MLNYMEYTRVVGGQGSEAYCKGFIPVLALKVNYSRTGVFMLEDINISLG